jgi:DNA modification methylase
MKLLQGDCREVMRTLPESSIDAIVTDPPYELGFMSKSWDKSGIANDPAMWAEALRVLKPGGHLLAFSGSRTYHRMVCAIEDAGFEIRDQIMWVYGSGFPKSHNIGNGWGTALKPAHEPIVVARKPLQGTVAANVQQWGTGALNIDGCRVEGIKDVPASGTKADSGMYGKGSSIRRGDEDGFNPNIGRWPANLLHDGSDEVMEAFAAFGEKKGFAGQRDLKETPSNYFGAHKSPGVREGFGDTGTAARFFKSCPNDDIDEAWQDRNLTRSNASVVELSSFPQKQLDVSALRDAATSALPVALSCEVHCQEPSTSATETDFGRLVAVVTETIQNIEAVSSLGLPLTSFTASSNLASVAVQSEPTGTTMITASHWKSDGSAAPVIFKCTPTNLGLGAKGSLSGSRFTYCAKASKADRGEGNGHPTVKPTALMRYLCRLITPPGGTILDPFMGSGSTGRGALLEGFSFVGIEMSPDYIAIAEKRIADACGADLFTLEAAE